MARDRSLDEFLAGAGSASDAASGSDAGSDGETGSTDADATSGPATEAGGPATPSVADADGPDGSGSGLEADLVYGWSIEERPCDGCGRAVSHRWYDGESVRCEDCKDWSPTRSETVADPSRAADDP